MNTQIKPKTAALPGRQEEISNFNSLEKEISGISIQRALREIDRFERICDSSSPKYQDYCLLALLYIRTDQSYRAIRTLEKAHKIHKNSVYVLYKICQLMIEEFDMHKEGIYYLKKLEKLEKNSKDIPLLKAKCYTYLYNTKKSFYLLEKYKNKYGETEKLLNQMAQLARTYGDIEYKTSLHYWKRSVELFESRYALSNLAKIYDELGQQSGAHDAARHLIALEGAENLSINFLLDFPVAESREVLANKLENLDFDYLKNAEIDTSKLAEFARLYDRVGQYKNAWELTNKWNVLERRRHEDLLPAFWKGTATSLERVKAYEVSPEKPQTVVAEAPSLLFILGPSRSGKTTLESMLACSRSVARGFETLRLSNREKKPANTPQADDALREFPFGTKTYAEFLVRLREESGNARYVTSTLPTLISSVGNNAELYPESKFIFVFRNMDDLILRILMKKYATRNHYAYDAVSIRRYVSFYYEAAGIWLEKLGDRALAVNYDEMVTSPGRVLQQISQFCDIEIDPNNPPQLYYDAGVASHYQNIWDIRQHSILEV
jgi:hypothetical protein